MLTALLALWNHIGVCVCDCRHCFHDLFVVFFWSESVYFLMFSGGLLLGHRQQASTFMILHGYPGRLRGFGEPAQNRGTA